MRRRPLVGWGAVPASNALLLAVLALDRATKAWARSSLAPFGSKPVLPFFRLTYVENTGAAFGFLRDNNALFIGLACALLIALAVWRRQLPSKDRLSRIALSLVLAGAAGNLFDRLAYGHVVDFLDFRVWPVFNVADSAISVGAALLALALWLGEKVGR